MNAEDILAEMDLSSDENEEEEEEEEENVNNAAKMPASGMPTTGPRPQYGPPSAMAADPSTAKFAQMTIPPSKETAAAAPSLQPFQPSQPPQASQAFQPPQPSESVQPSQPPPQQFHPPQAPPSPQASQPSSPSPQLSQPSPQPSEPSQPSPQRFQPSQASQPAQASQPFQPREPSQAPQPLQSSQPAELSQSSQPPPQRFQPSQASQPFQAPPSPQASQPLQPPELPQPSQPPPQSFQPPQSSEPSSHLFQPSQASQPAQASQPFQHPEPSQPPPSPTTKASSPSLPPLVTEPSSQTEISSTATSTPSVAESPRSPPQTAAPPPLPTAETLQPQQESSTISTFPVIDQEYSFKDMLNDFKSDVKQPGAEENAASFSQLDTTVSGPMSSPTDQDTMVALPSKGETGTPLKEPEKTEEDLFGIQNLGGNFHHRSHTVGADPPNPEPDFSHDFSPSSGNVGNLSINTGFDRLNESSPFAGEVAGQKREEEEEEAAITKSDYSETRQFQQFSMQHGTLQTDMVAATAATWNDKPESSETTRSTESATHSSTGYDARTSIESPYEGSSVFMQNSLDYALASEPTTQSSQQNAMVYQENQAFGMYSPTAVSPVRGQENKGFGETLMSGEAAQEPFGYDGSAFGPSNFALNRTDASGSNAMGKLDVYNTDVGITQGLNTSFVSSPEASANMSELYASSFNDIQAKEETDPVATGQITSPYQDFSEQVKENRDVGGNGNDEDDDDDDDDDNIDADLLASRLMKASQEYSSGSDEEPGNVNSHAVAPGSTTSTTGQPYYDSISVTKDSLESSAYGGMDAPRTVEEVDESKDRALQEKKSRILQDSQERQNLQEKARARLQSMRRVATSDFQQPSFPVEDEPPQPLKEDVTDSTVEIQSKLEQLEHQEISSWKELTMKMLSNLENKLVDLSIAETASFVHSEILSFEAMPFKSTIGSISCSNGSGQGLYVFGSITGLVATWQKHSAEMVVMESGASKQKGNTDRVFPAITSCALSSDMSRIASGNARGTISIFDTTKRKEVKLIDKEHASPISVLQFIDFPSYYAFQLGGNSDSGSERGGDSLHISSSGSNGFVLISGDTSGSVKMHTSGSSSSLFARLSMSSSPVLSAPAVGIGPAATAIIPQPVASSKIFKAIGSHVGTPVFILGANGGVLIAVNSEGAKGLGRLMKPDMAESDVCLPVGAWSTSPGWSNVFASGWGRLLHVSVLEPEQSNSDQISCNTAGCLLDPTGDTGNIAGIAFIGPAGTYMVVLSSRGSASLVALRTEGSMGRDGGQGALDISLSTICVFAMSTKVPGLSSSFCPHFTTMFENSAGNPCYTYNSGSMIKRDTVVIPESGEKILNGSLTVLGHDCSLTEVKLRTIESLVNEVTQANEWRKCFSILNSVLERQTVSDCFVHGWMMDGEDYGASWKDEHEKLLAKFGWIQIRNIFLEITQRYCQSVIECEDSSFVEKALKGGSVSHLSPSREDILFAASFLISALCIKCGKFGLDLVFREVYPLCKAFSKLEGLFCALESAIISGVIKSVPTEIVQEMVEYRAARGETKRVEAVIMSLDIFSLDLNQTIKLSQRYDLINAFIDISTRCLKDYIAPLLYLLQERQTSSSDTIEHFNALKALSYIRCFSRSKRHPFELSVMANQSDGSQTTTMHMLSDEEKEEGLQSIFSSLLRDQEQMLKPILFAVPSECTEVLQAIFDVWDSVGETSSNSVNNLSFLQQVCDLMTEYCQISKFRVSNDSPRSSARHEESLSKGLLKRTHLNFGVAEELIPQVLEFLAHFSSMGRIKLSAPPSPPKEVGEEEEEEEEEDESDASRICFLEFCSPLALEAIIEQLCWKASTERSQSDLNRSYATENTLAKIVELVPEYEIDMQTAIKTCIRTGMCKVAALLYIKQGDWSSAFDQYLQSPKFAPELFTLVNNQLMQESDKHSIAPLLRDAIIQRLTQLVELNAEETARIVILHFPQDFELMLRALSRDKELQLAYLQGIIGQNQSSESLESLLTTNGMTLTDSMIELYIELLCQLQPENVLPFLESRENIRLEETLSTCQRHSAHEASAFILERMGDVSGALTNLIRCFESSLSELINIFSKKEIVVVSEAERADHEGQSTIFFSHQEKKVSDALMKSIRLCQRNNARMNENEAKELWFTILDSCVEPLRKLKRMGYSKQVEDSQDMVEENKILLEEVLADLVQTVLESLMGYIPVQAVLQRIVARHGSDEWGHFRGALQGILGSLNYESVILSSAKAVISGEAYSSYSDLISVNKRGRGIHLR